MSGMTVQFLVDQLSRYSPDAEVQVFGDHGGIWGSSYTIEAVRPSGSDPKVVHLWSLVRQPEEKVRQEYRVRLVRAEDLTPSDEARPPAGCYSIEGRLATAIFSLVRQVQPDGVDMIVTFRADDSRWHFGPGVLIEVAVPA